MEAKRKTTEKTKQVHKKRTSKSSSAKHPTSSSKGKNTISKDTRAERLFKEKLGSLSVNIDLIQKMLKNTDMDIDEVQKKFSIIFDDINFFLKSLPQIKNNELLNSYNKTYKKLVGLLKSTNINFDCAKVFQADNHVKNTVLSENNILVEKINDNATVLYKTKYKDEDENTIVDIYSENGEVGHHCKIKPDGNKETLPVSFTNNNIFGDTRLEMVIEKPFDESKFTVIDHMIVNKKFYENINDKLFTDKKSFNLKLINSLFEFIALQSVSSRKKNNKIFDFRLSINVSNLMNDNENNLALDTDNITQKKEVSHEHLLLNVAFPKNQKSILVARSNTGKSLLSIEIGSC